MANRFVIFMILLSALIPFAGCKPESAEPFQVEPSKPELVKPEQPEAEPPEPETIEAEPPETEVPEAESQKVAVPDVVPPEVETTKTPPSEPKTAQRVSFHDKCADILNNFVDDRGMVNYKELKRKKLELNRLLDEFAKLDPNEYTSWPKEDKIAFWINACNIKMLEIIVGNYPIQSTRILRILWGPDSVRHIDKSIGGIWKSKFIVMDEEFTLAEIQKRFFQKEFDEPRVFFALSLACLSSPPLRNEPYYGYKLNEQLDNQAKKFLSGPEAFKIDREGKVVYLSALLKPTWHGKKFVAKFGTDKKFKDQVPEIRAVLNFLTDYISRGDISFLEVENYTVDYTRFDWNLNDGS